VIIVAPVSVLEHLEPIVQGLRAKVQRNPQRHPLMALLLNYLPTIVVFLINSLLLPYLIEVHAIVCSVAICMLCCDGLIRPSEYCC